MTRSIADVIEFTATRQKAQLWRALEEWVKCCSDLPEHWIGGPGRGVLRIVHAPWRLRGRRAGETLTALRLEEREKISRGIAGPGQSIRQIAA